ncbi:PREDICTED: synaptic vesicle glycoprotein 2B-like [Nicrophorus vespilloides]|uniref:Synaptic vesicle glycoprotein 2B-like n=1 Tax=Nicrophorus vespilloides TaxID=110193 RepID=A0ABM1N9U9_NICVS|nr:PREDICTED: synaptic vesicle glycoprotein 2B-like [Nicrophorus vespilloides]
MGFQNYNSCDRKHKFEEAVALTGYGKFNLKILLASGGCLMVVIIETMAMMFVVPASQCDLDLSLSTKGLLSAISFLGVVSSSHMWGFIADTRGRRNVLIVSMIMSFITSLISSIIPYDWLFIFIRFINGFFVGGASAVVYAYAGEFHDRIYRPKVVSWIATFVAFGNMLIPGLAWLILPLDFNFPISFLENGFRPWRLLVICYGLPSLLFAFFLSHLPESPKYLVAQGRCEEALNILKHMYSKNYNRNPDEFPVFEIESEEDLSLKNGGVLKTMWFQTAPLFKKPYLLKTLMVSFLQFGAFFSSSGLIMWYPEVLNRMASFSVANPDESVEMCKSIEYYNEITANSTITSDICMDTVDVNAFLTSLLIGVVFAFMYIFIGAVINIVGAKKLLISLLIITTSCGIAAQNVKEQLSTQILMGIFLTEATCVGIINAIVVELFPTQLRAMALAISLMAGRFGAVAGSNATGPIIYSICNYMYYIFAVDHLLLIITVLLLPSPPSIKKMIQPNV